MTDSRDPPAARRELGGDGLSYGQGFAGGYRRRWSLVGDGSPRRRVVGVLAAGLPTLTVAFAVVMAMFLLAESVADAVATGMLRAIGIAFLILLIADGLTLACILGLEAAAETPLSTPTPPPPPRSAQNRD